MGKKNKNKITKNLISNFILWTLIIVISVTMLNYFDLSKKSRNIPYSAFISLLNDNKLNQNISKATITGNDLIADCDPGCILSGYEDIVLQHVDETPWTDRQMCWRPWQRTALLLHICYTCHIYICVM